MKHSILLFLFTLAIFDTKADSPLTSIQFWTAYVKEPVITTAKEAKGVLTPELADFLISKKNKTDLKMAVINCLSYDEWGYRKNSNAFLKRILDKGVYNNSEDLKNNGKADHILCMAYLMAMDYYFQAHISLVWFKKALLKNEQSFTFQIIYALVNAELIFEKNKCESYKLTDEVRKNTSLKQDMNPEAVRIIFDYMDVFKSSCD